MLHCTKYEPVGTIPGMNEQLQKIDAICKEIRQLSGGVALSKQQDGFPDCGAVFAKHATPNMFDRPYGVVPSVERPDDRYNVTLIDLGASYSALQNIVQIINREIGSQQKPSCLEDLDKTLPVVDQPRATLAPLRDAETTEENPHRDRPTREASAYLYLVLIKNRDLPTCMR